MTIRTHAARHALAPLEMILVLPLLMLMLGIIMALGAAGLAKLSSSAKARLSAWQQRDSDGEAENSLVPPLPSVSVLRTGSQDGQRSAPARGLHEATANRVTRVPLVARFPIRMRSSVTVLGDTWDHRTVTFRRLEPFQIDQRLLRLPDVPGEAANLLDSLTGAVRDGRASAEGAAAQVRGAQVNLQTGRDGLRSFGKLLGDEDALKDLAERSGLSEAELKSRFGRGSNSADDIGGLLRKVP